MFAFFTSNSCSFLVIVAAGVVVFVRWHFSLEHSNLQIRTQTTRVDDDDGN